MEPTQFASGNLDHMFAADPAETVSKLLQTSDQRKIHKNFDMRNGKKADASALMKNDEIIMMDPAKILYLRPEYARNINHKVFIQKKHDAAAYHINANLIYNAEVSNFKQRIFAFITDYRDKLPADAEQMFGSAPNLHEAFGELATDTTAHARLTEIQSSRNRCYTLANQANQYKDATILLQRLGWATRGRFAAALAPMFSKNVRKIAWGVAFFIITTIPFFAIPAMWDMYKKRQQAKAMPINAQTTPQLPPPPAGVPSLNS